MALNRETTFGFRLTIAAIMRRLGEAEFRPAAARRSCRTGPDFPRSSPQQGLLSRLALDRSSQLAASSGSGSLMIRISVRPARAGISHYAQTNAMSQIKCSDNLLKMLTAAPHDWAQRDSPNAGAARRSPGSTTSRACRRGSRAEVKAPARFSLVLAGGAGRGAKLRRYL